MLVSEVRVVVSCFCEFVDMLVDLALALYFGKVLVEKSPLEIEESVLDKGVNCVA